MRCSSGSSSQTSRSGPFRRSAPSARSTGSRRWSHPRRRSCATESSAGSPSSTSSSGTRAVVRRRSGGRGRNLVSADGLALDESNLTGESELCVRGPARRSGPARSLSRGSRCSRSQRSVPTAARRASDRDRASVPSSALAARAGQRPAAAVAGGVRRPARDRARGVGARSRRDSTAARVQVLTAGVVNLVPEGLILLISLTAAVSAFKMAQRGVLAQQLNAIESLASVDIVCTDKTGTLTEPTLRVVGLVPAVGTDEARLSRELARYAASSPSRNLTLEAIASAGLANVEPRRASSPRCRSPPGGAGARSTSVTSDSSSGRRSASRGRRRVRRPRTRGGQRGPARVGPRPHRLAAAPRELGATVPRRCAAARASSCSPSGCAPTRRTRSPFSPLKRVDLKVLSGDAPAYRRRDRPRRGRTRIRTGARR